MKGAKQVGKYTLRSGVTVKFFLVNVLKVHFYSLHNAARVSADDYQMAKKYANDVCEKLDQESFKNKNK